MVRLVFRPYTQIRRSICTSEPLRASTRVSSGFALFRHSSPSFGSQQLCSNSEPRVNPRNRSAVSPLKAARSEEHTSELQSQSNLVCRLLLEKKNTKTQLVTRTRPHTRLRRHTT